uniref:Putative receptor-like protein kinase At1g49730 n=1 Tax=Anthurium amnicola TaxID=1678845 RepID=A0A1D1ZIK8_9ARAE
MQGILPFLRHFTYKEIKRATDGFSRIVGSDGNGPIYKAQFPDGLVATVKKIRAFEEGKYLHRELQILGRLHHRHLVKLQGFSEGQDRFLVFDYIENGSLKEFLHDPLRTPLNWRTRLQIAFDVAAALEYLHLFCDPPIHSVTISADNILLDRNFVAKLSTFGSLSSDGHQLPDSYAQDSKESIIQRNKNILFQFGVLILELVTGQSFGSEGADLMQWIQQSNFTYSMHKMVDSDLGNTYDSKELKSLLIMARMCTKIIDEPVISISQVLRYLQRKVEQSTAQA